MCPYSGSAADHGRADDQQLAVQLEESRTMEIESEPQSNGGGLNSNLELAIAAMAAEADTANCSMGQHKWLDEGNRMHPAPRNTTRGVA